MHSNATPNARSTQRETRVSSFVRLTSVGLLLGCALACNQHGSEASPLDPRGNTASVASSSSAAPGASAHSDVGGKPSAMGELAQAPSYSLRVYSAKACQPASWQRSKPGFTRIGFDLEITGKSAARVAANAFYARLKDQEGKAYRPVFGGCEPDLRHAPLAAGQTARGFVTFEVPDTAGQLSLRYQPQLSGPPEPLEFDLGSSPASAAP